MAVQESARQAVGLALRHDLDEADNGGNEEEDADHGENAETAEYQLVAERIFEEDEGCRRRNQHDRQQNDAYRSARTPPTIHKRRVIVVDLTRFRHLFLA